MVLPDKWAVYAPPATTRLRRTNSAPLERVQGGGSDGCHGHGLLSYILVRPFHEVSDVAGDEDGVPKVEDGVC